MLEAAKRAARAALAKGRPLVLFAEGTRIPHGLAPPLRAGFAGIYRLLGVPVIPVAMINTHKLNPPGSVLPRPAKIVVKVGKPLDFSRYDGLQGNRFIERAITDEIMYSLMELSGQQYVDVYAASLKNKPAQSDSPSDGGSTPAAA